MTACTNKWKVTETRKQHSLVCDTKQLLRVSNNFVPNSTYKHDRPRGRHLSVWRNPSESCWEYFPPTGRGTSLFLRSVWSVCATRLNKKREDLHLWIKGFNFTKPVLNKRQSDSKEDQLRSCDISKFSQNGTEHVRMFLSKEPRADVASGQSKRFQ